MLLHVIISIIRKKKHSISEEMLELMNATKGNIKAKKK